ncbi:MAG TPA: hypothetical protein VE127_11405 [Solirubrobacteraceae bacterium]|nr:hypothetical protein [Solirubrobacteraceae bacterium]
MIVLDPSVAIAALSARDVHHKAAVAALSLLRDEDELVLAATTRTEILVGPERIGGEVLQSASAFVAGCATIPLPRRSRMGPLGAQRRMASGIRVRSP